MLSLFLFSCESEQEKLVDQIKTISSEMKEEAFPSEENMDKVVILYDSYIDQFPDAEETYTYMELKAKYLSANNKHEEALLAYDELIAKYPEDLRSADALFMQAFIIENYIIDKVKAKEKYSDFLKYYPSHELADDAQFSIDNLGMSDEALLEKLKAMLPDSTEIFETN
ncbi:MAG: tetratricopeptide (TPR) repeat protein [Chitinophagales bacterium]|jgi:tetratricopeptide (TPR) repeat protein